MMFELSAAKEVQQLENGSDLLRFWLPTTQQIVFRSLINAFSYPGQMTELTHADGSVAILATLVDAETTLADPDQLLSDLTKTRLNAPIVAAEQANYIIVRGNMNPRFTPQLGTLESPESGATVVVLIDSFTDSGRWCISGPGIKRPWYIDFGGLDSSWLDTRNIWCSSFPLGVDLILTDQKRCLALPRTTLIVDTGAN